MPIEVILPKVDMDMATGQISRWFVEDGATVKKGDVLFEIETDKAAMEIDAPASGIIRDITGKEGVDIPVGEAVAWIYAEGEARSERRPDERRRARRREALRRTLLPDTIAEEGRHRRRAQAPATGEARESGGVARATPLARRLAREAGLPIPAITAPGPRGRIVRADVEAAVVAAKSVPARQSIVGANRSVVSEAETGLGRCGAEAVRAGFL